jgi:hypothetical protein
MLWLVLQLQPLSVLPHHIMLSFNNSKKCMTYGFSEFMIWYVKHYDVQVQMTGRVICGNHKQKELTNLDH